MPLRGSILGAQFHGAFAVSYSNLGRVKAYSLWGVPCCVPVNDAFTIVIDIEPRGLDHENLGVGGAGGAWAGYDVAVVRSAAESRSRDTLGAWVLVYWPGRGSQTVGRGNTHFDPVAVSARKCLRPGHAQSVGRGSTRNQSCPGSPASFQAHRASC